MSQGNYVFQIILRTVALTILLFEIVKHTTFQSANEQLLRLSHIQIFAG